MESNYYIYCVANYFIDKIPVDITGLDGYKVSTVKYVDICAIISGTSRTHFDANLENLKHHEEVINNIMNYCTVLPMKFSTIVKSMEDVEKLLEKYYCQFKDNLKKVEDKVELGIKIFCKMDSLLEEGRIEGSSGKEYFLKKYSIYQENKKKLEPYLKMAGEINSELSELSCDNCCTNPLKNNLMMNASYLVQRENIEKFTKSVDSFKKKYDLLKVIYSGPWAPYHFVKIKEEGDGIG